MRPVHLLILISAIALPAIYGQEVDAHLVAAYAFSEGQGDSTTDSSAHANEAQLVNSPQWIVDGENSALEFSSSNKTGVNLGTTASIAGTNAFTVSVWIKTNTAAEMVIIQQRSKAISGVTDGYNGEWQLATKPTGQLRFCLYKDGCQFDFSSNASLNDNQWLRSNPNINWCGRSWWTIGNRRKSRTILPNLRW